MSTPTGIKTIVYHFAPGTFTYEDYQQNSSRKNLLAHSTHTEVINWGEDDPFTEEDEEPG